MCCIFTCFGWMLDLIQRCWVFAMSCLISSAVTCVLLTSATGGIALGYNYSLAEYIDLRETNVSVYIKRGVFDDEIADDMDWRRAGHKPDISGFISDQNLKTGAPAGEEDQSLKSGRRLDDSIYESDHQNKYEGSLLKLTAKAPLQVNPRPEPSPPYQPFTASTVSTYTDRGKMEELMDRFPVGSLDQLKAIQSVLNARRMEQPDNRVIQEPIDLRKNFMPPTTKIDEFKYVNRFPGFPGSGGSARREQDIKSEIAMPSNRFRDAVPRMDLNGWNKNAVVKPGVNPDYEDGKPPTFPPRPPTPKPSPIRPETPPPTKESIFIDEYRPSRTKKPSGNDKAFEDFDKHKPRLFGQYDVPNLKDDNLHRKKPVDEDYEEEFRGAPVRKKRNVNYNENADNEPITNTKNVDPTKNPPAPSEFLKLLFPTKNNTDFLGSNNTKQENMDIRQDSRVGNRRQNLTTSTGNKKKITRYNVRKKNNRKSAIRKRKLKRPKLGKHVMINGVLKTWKRKIIYLKETSSVKPTKVHLPTLTNSIDVCKQNDTNNNTFDQFVSLSSTTPINNGTTAENNPTVTNSEEISVGSRTSRVISDNTQRLITKIIQKIKV